MTDQGCVAVLGLVGVEGLEDANTFLCSGPETREVRISNTLRRWGGESLDVLARLGGKLAALPDRRGDARPGDETGEEDDADEECDGH